MNKISTQIFSKSVVGNAHIAKGMPNQDSVRAWIAHDGIHFCIAISDGHGSSSHPFSDVGSKFAVDVSIEAYKFNYDNEESKLNPSSLFGKVISEWSDQCINHYNQQGLGNSISEESILKLYGATLSIAYVCKDTISLGSIGDSTVFARNHSGLFSQFLIHDESPGEATFSLCQANAINYLEVKHIPYASGIILLSTDGVIKSLKKTSDYALIADYYLKLISSAENESSVSDDLTAQLNSFSRDGSGDDCTLAIVYIPGVEIRSDASTLTRSKGDHPTYLPVTSSNIKDKKKLVPRLVFPLSGILALLLIALYTNSIGYKPILNQFQKLIKASFCQKSLSRPTLPTIKVLTSQL